MTPTLTPDPLPVLHLTHSIIEYLERQALSAERLEKISEDAESLENVHVMAKLLMAIK